MLPTTLARTRLDMENTATARPVIERDGDIVVLIRVMRYLV